MTDNKTGVPANRPIGYHLVLLHYLHRIIVFVGRFICAVYYGKDSKPIPAIKNEFLKKSASQLAEDIRNEKISSVELLQLFIQRNHEVNPFSHYLVENRYDKALEEAEEVDQIVRSTTDKKDLAQRKPFLGVPFTTKDCLAVKGMLHTSGVVLRKGVQAKEDSLCIKYLKEAGAICIGLTNVSELCMWWESHNRVHGRTKNAYDRTRIVGGSSGGEGCCQSVCGSAFGVGSDIGGSIRMPCFFNGVFGHKPSRFIVSNLGQYPEPLSQLQKMYIGLGPISRHAADLKPLLKIMAGENAAKLHLDDSVDLSKLKLYYQFDNGGAPMVDPVDPEIRNAMRIAVDYLSIKFNMRAYETNIERLVKSNPIWLSTMTGEISFSQMIMGKEGTWNIIKELMKHIVGLSNNTLIGLFTALFEKTGCKIGDAKYKHYERARNHLETEFNSILKQDGVFLYPTHPTPAPYHNEPLIKPFNFCYTSIINCMGFPATHIPTGLGKERLPIGFQVVSNVNNDRLCLAVAQELEKFFGGWIEPGTK